MSLSAEHFRRRAAEEVLQLMAIPLAPGEELLPGFARFDTGTDQLLDAVIAGRKFLDRNMQFDAPKDRDHAMKQLLGAAYQMRGKSYQIPKALLPNLIAQAAQTETDSVLEAILKNIIQTLTLQWIAAPATTVINWVSGELQQVPKIVSHLLETAMLRTAPDLTIDVPLLEPQKDYPVIYRAGVHRIVGRVEGSDTRFVNDKQGLLTLSKATQKAIARYHRKVLKTTSPLDNAPNIKVHTVPQYAFMAALTKNELQSFFLNRKYIRPKLEKLKKELFPNELFEPSSWLNFFRDTNEQGEAVETIASKMLRFWGFERVEAAQKRRNLWDYFKAYGKIVADLAVEDHLIPDTAEARAEFAMTYIRKRTPDQVLFDGWSLVDNFNFDYENAPEWIKAGRRNPIARGVVPFVTYGYKYFKNIDFNYGLGGSTRIARRWLQGVPAGKPRAITGAALGAIGGAATGSLLGGPLGGLLGIMFGTPYGAWMGTTGGYGAGGQPPKGPGRTGGGADERPGADRSREDQIRDWSRVLTGFMLFGGAWALLEALGETGSDRDKYGRRLDWEDQTAGRVKANFFARLLMVAREKAPSATDFFLRVTQLPIFREAVLLQGIKSGDFGLPEFMSDFFSEGLLVRLYGMLSTEYVNIYHENHPKATEMGELTGEVILPLLTGIPERYLRAARIQADTAKRKVYDNGWSSPQNYLAGLLNDIPVLSRLLPAKRILKGEDKGKIKSYHRDLEAWKFLIGANLREVPKRSILNEEADIRQADERRREELRATRLQEVAEEYFDGDHKKADEYIARRVTSSSIIVKRRAREEYGENIPDGARAEIAHDINMKLLEEISNK
jgi:hypothetical protein